MIIPVEEHIIPEANFQPSKRFFVSMLTRDIDLTDAILDLLDNCIDGALRVTEKNITSGKPYTGYEANITINESYFEITDNCGGIPKKDWRYAFRMGRPEENKNNDQGTVGIYGIGMKRAIFKMGESATINSNSSTGSFSVKISPDWTKNQEWTLPLNEKEIDKENTFGTEIRISNLHETISQKFGESTFIGTIKDQVRHSLSFIIQKGFIIRLNGEVIHNNPINIIVSENVIQPYIYKSQIGRVNIDLVVGFYRNMSENDSDDIDYELRRSSEDAGWTIICNDRVVLYCDKTHLTGWGIPPVPRFHPQFNAISGVVRFTSNYPEDLPITTTKRGVDLGSPLYNEIRNRMMEGTVFFTKFTNNWKGAYLSEGKKLLTNTTSISANEFLNKSVDELKKVNTGNWTNPNKNSNEHRFTPTLPKVKISSNKKRISFIKNEEDIIELSEYFFGEDDRSPSEVGEKCFETVLKEIKG